MTDLNVSLNHITAISAMIGYCQSLEVGTVITEDYMKRMNEYYVPKLEAVRTAFTEATQEQPRVNLECLEKCAIAAHDTLHQPTHPDVPPGYAWVAVAKAVLNAAGVPYDETPTKDSVP